MRLRYTQSSFRDGVISPRMQGQVELESYRSSLGKLQNFIVLPQSAVARRPGTYFASSTKSNSYVRLIPFSFGGAESYMLEFGNLYIRFYKNDGVLFQKNISDVLTTTPYEIVSPFGGSGLSEDQLKSLLEDISFVQSADVIFLAHPDFPPQRLIRENGASGEVRAGDDTKWSFEEIEFLDGPYDAVNADEDFTLTISATQTEKDLGRFEVNSVEHLLQQKNHGLLDGQQITISGQVADFNTAQIHPYNKSYYVVNATANTFQLTESIVAATGRPDVPVKFGHVEVNGNGDIVSLDYVYTHNGKVTGTRGAEGVTGKIKITAEGGTATATASQSLFSSAKDVGRLIRFNTFKGDQLYWCYGKIASVSSATVATITLKRDLLLIGETDEWQLGQWNSEDGYPRTVTIYQQRLCYAGSSAYPQTIWFSKTGDFYNFAASEPIGTATGAVTSSGARVIGEQINADNAISLIVDSDTVDQVTWLLAARKLVMGTSGGIFNIYGSENNLSITPANFTIEKATQYPAEKKTNALLIDKSVIYIQTNSRRMLELDYSSADDINKLVVDMTMRAEHLTRPKLKKTIFQSQPYSVIWTLMQDGTLASCTFDKLQNMYSWSSHILGGSFNSGSAVVEDIGVIPRGTHDQIWMVVKRTVNGSTVRYLEYLDNYYDTSDTNLEKAHFVDSGLYATNETAFTTVTGLNHLEGETVSVHASGAIHPSRVVSSGEVTINHSTNNAVVGLPFISQIKTLPLVVGPTGIIFGNKRRIHTCTVKLYEALGVKIGLEENDLTEILFRTSGIAMGQAPDLFTGEKLVTITNKSYDLGEILVQCDSTFPSTILAFSYDYEASDV